MTSAESIVYNTQDTESVTLVDNKKQNNQ